MQEYFYLSLTSNAFSIAKGRLNYIYPETPVELYYYSGIKCLLKPM
jgi:hypothetical protein